MISLVGVPIGGNIVDYIPEINSFSGRSHKGPSAEAQQLLKCELGNVSLAQRSYDYYRPMACPSTTKHSFKYQKLHARNRINLKTEHAFLESEFQKNPHLNMNEISKLAMKLGFDIGKTQNWFRNRRLKCKRELLRSHEMITQNITPPEMVNMVSAIHQNGSAPQNVSESRYEPIYSPISPAASDNPLPDSRFVQDASLLTPLNTTLLSPLQSVENSSYVQENTISTLFDSNMLTPESIVSPSSLQENSLSTSFDNIIFTPEGIENPGFDQDNISSATFENICTPQSTNPSSLQQTSFTPSDNSYIGIENTSSDREASYSTVLDNIVFSPISMQILEDILF